LDEQDIETFLRESRAVAQLNHPNIVGIHEVGRADDGTVVTDTTSGRRQSTSLDIVARSRSASILEKNSLANEMKPEIAITPQPKPTNNAW
jgi:serine/threonine protein kinase